MTKRKRPLDPNRFRQPVSQKFLSFDPIRRSVFLWGFIVGTAGGFLMLRPEFVWQVVGVIVVVLVSNYHISKAARKIPRWHATLISLAGAMLGIFLIFGLLSALGGGLFPGLNPG